MTDKEIIEIDGVDVSGCKHYRKCILPDNIGCKIDDMLCCDKPNCYFKQLSRKTAECEELEEKIERVEEDLKYSCVDCMNVRSNKYYEALNDIEELISGKYETLDPLAKQQIQNIISKAKDGKE